MQRVGMGRAKSQPIKRIDDAVGVGHGLFGVTHRPGQIAQRQFQFGEVAGRLGSIFPILLPDALPLLVEKAGDRAQVGAERAEFARAVEFIPTQDAGVVHLITRLLLHPRQTTMRDRLVQRLQVIDRRLLLIRGVLAQIRVQPPMRRLPSVALFGAEPLCKIFAQQRMRIDCDDDARFLL